MDELQQALYPHHHHHHHQAYHEKGWRKGVVWARIVTEVAFLCVGFCLGYLVFWSLTKQDVSKSAIVYSNLPKPSKFLVLGDWGRDGFYNQSNVAIQMGRIGEQMGIDFVISTGDNFYDKGLVGVNDPKFTTSFTNVYTAPSLQKTWYSVLGNHDYMGDTHSQLSSELIKRDPRWHCEREFQLRQPLCQHSILGECKSYVEFFFIDTSPFIDQYWDPNNDERFNWRDLDPRKKQLRKQLQRLSKNLKESSATWKIVVGHHTIRSIGHHGDYEELLTQVLPILEDNGVKIYINGHDHTLQYIKRTDSEVHFLTSGAGSKAYGGLRSASEEDGVQFAFDGQGFLAVSLEPTSFSFTFYDVSGNSLISSSIYNNIQFN